jgi:hypothetical protein
VSTTNLLNYIASSGLTISLNSLGSSSTWLSGRQATAVDNTSNKYLDYHLSGQVKVGTPTGTTGEIRIYVVSMIDDSTWPDTFGATDAAVTVTSVGVGQGFLKLAATMAVDATTTGRVYPFGKVSVASLFGGVCPPKFTVFVTHNTGAALDASAGGTVTIAGVDTTNG